MLSSPDSAVVAMIQSEARTGRGSTQPLSDAPSHGPTHHSYLFLPIHKQSHPVNPVSRALSTLAEDSFQGGCGDSSSLGTWHFLPGQRVDCLRTYYKKFSFPNIWVPLLQSYECASLQRMLGNVVFSWIATCLAKIPVSVGWGWGGWRGLWHSAPPPVSSEVY